MKHFLVFALLLVASSPAWTQEQYLELLRQDFKTKKTAVVTEALKLSEKEAAAFWPIYREFDVELAKLGDRRMALIKDFASKYESMTPEAAEGLMKGFFSNQHDRLDLLEDYNDKIAEAVGPVTAAKFVQLESTIQSVIDVQISDALPLIKSKSEPKAEPDTKK